jgi:hypothetical protein
MAHGVRLVALVGVTVLMAGGVATAAPPAAPHAAKAKKPVETYLFGFDRRVTTSTGTRLAVTVGADRFSSGGGDADITLSRGHESHDWNIPVRRSTFRFSVRSGRGSVVTGSQLGKLGTMTLRVSRGGPTRTKTCAGGNFSQKTPVTVTASLSFVPHSRTWGTIGSAAKAATFTSRGVVEIDHGRIESGCFDAAFHPSCPAERDWNGPSDQSVFLSGGWVRRHGARHGFIAAQRTVEIGAGGGFRDDSLERAAPAPTFVSHHGTVLVRVSAHGVAGGTGSASLRSVGPRTTSSFGCGHHTLVHQQTWSASYTNGRTPLMIASAVGRPFRERDSTRLSGIAFMSAAAAKAPQAADGSRNAIRPSSP